MFEIPKLFQENQAQIITESNSYSIRLNMASIYSTILHLFSFGLLIVCITPSMSCFANKQAPYVPPVTPSGIQMSQKQQSVITLITQSQLRSYHPHYLNSLSYPYPITPHIYFAQVIGTQPLFAIKYIEDYNPNSIQKFSVNGVQFMDLLGKKTILRREQSFRYMFVIQIENYFEEDISYNLHVFRRKDHFLVVCQYRDKFNAFVVYITHNNAIKTIDPQKLVGIKLNVRNQSHPNHKLNWRMSDVLRWRGASNVPNPQLTSYSGFVLEIQYIDHSLKEGFRLNLHQISNKKHLSLESFARAQQKMDFSKLVPSKLKKVVKNADCTNAAADKIFEGLSYEYGTLKIKNGFETIANSPQELLSFSPSRKRFPWGFLWDDGFHCQVSVRKDQRLTLKVIKSWLDTMLDNGWIPRQQNRGQQRQELCNCPRFMEKDIKDGNPPTLILALEHLRRLNRLNKDNFPLEYWAKIKKWYKWFITTQKDDDSFLFKWKDSINQAGASFTSGMDDFPRPFMAKSNIDLQSWIYFFTKFMVETAHIYNDTNTEYITNLQLLKQNFKLFIDPATNTYKDVSYDGRHSEHFGYPSILPIAFGIPEYQSKQYENTIVMIKTQLDTGTGLSSLSKQSPYYLRTPDAYWRGPVWLNLNYMFLRGLKLYYPQQSQYYKKIRDDLMKNVCGNWQKTGYFYENYINGKGSFSFPFNGWTSLISIIIDESY